MANYRGPKRTVPPLLLWGMGLPLLLVGLFYLLRQNTVAVVWWVDTILRPVAYALGRISALFPFAVGEALLLVLGFFALLWLALESFRWVKHRQCPFSFQHLSALIALILWGWALLSWMWNVVYFTPSFAQRSGLDVSPYSVEPLYAVTEIFIQKAATLSTEVTRDEALHYAVAQEYYFEGSLSLYDQLESRYPFLTMHTVKPKALLLSPLQSYFGFTGMYSPLTGEANINTHTPAMMHPATIAHEMAHQRLIAPELEANFLAVLACLEHEDVVFQYSGALLGTMELSNALFSVAPELWYALTDQYFTPELATDWQDNNDYWAQFQSSSDNVVKDVYDSFLKGNDQELGIRSYGACVDLLVAYYGE